jgi:SMC interacting uncharacterized protein involved in chromosome segregation
MDEQQTRMTDPASRLIAILQGGITKTPQNESFLKLWATTFGDGVDNLDAIYRHLDALRDLIDDVERGITQIPDIKHDQYLKWLPNLSSIISRPNLQEQWGSQITNLQMIINALEFASERLQAYAPEPEIPQNELDAIQQEVTDLLKTLERSETIEKSLKLILFDLLSLIQRSINEYKFRGIKGVRQQLFVVACEIQQHLPEFEKAKNAEEVKGFFKILKRIDLLTSTALHVKELMYAAAPLLPIIPALLEHLPK